MRVGLIDITSNREMSTLVTIWKQLERKMSTIQDGRDVE